MLLFSPFFATVLPFLATVLTFLCYCSHLSCYCSHLSSFGDQILEISELDNRYPEHTQSNVILNYNFFFSSTFLNSFCSQGPVLRPGFYTLCTIFGRCRDSTPSCYNCSRYATDELHTSLDNIINLNINFLCMEIIVLNFP